MTITNHKVLRFPIERRTMKTVQKAQTARVMKPWAANDPVKLETALRYALAQLRSSNSFRRLEL